MKRIFFTTIFSFLIVLLSNSCKKDNDSSNTNQNSQIIVCTSCDGQNSFTDPRDGKVYDIVRIGNQCWFADNLRYTGSIPQIPSTTMQSNNNNEWLSNTTGAWCYNHTPEDDAVYGKIYNWYAVNANICPQGWHIPTDADWTTLINYLGGSSVAGGKMKSIEGWSNPNTGATNESCFSAVAGGVRNSNGWLDFKGLRGWWWSSTENDIHNAWARGMSNDGGGAGRNFHSKSSGFSCRCIKD